MENGTGTLRILWVFIVLTSCVMCGFASGPPRSQPVATLDLSALLSGHSEPAWATVAFSSETSIAVGLCRKDCAKKCSLSLVRWEGRTLRPFAQTVEFDSGMSIHPASEGQILTFRRLYSADSCIHRKDVVPSAIDSHPTGNDCYSTTRIGRSSCCTTWAILSGRSRL